MTSSVADVSSSLALSAWRWAMISLLLKLSGQAGPLAIHSLFLPLHRLWSSQGNPAARQLLGLSQRLLVLGAKLVGQCPACSCQCNCLKRLAVLVCLGVQEYKLEDDVVRVKGSANDYMYRYIWPTRTGFMSSKQTRIHPNQSTKQALPTTTQPNRLQPQQPNQTGSTQVNQTGRLLMGTCSSKQEGGGGQGWGLGC